MEPTAERWDDRVAVRLHHRAVGAAMEPTAERWDDIYKLKHSSGEEDAAMEPTAERWDDGSRNSCRLTCGNTRPCEHLSAREENETTIELSRSKNSF